jgi:hypothetical protein
VPENVDVKVYNNIFYANANSEKSANVYGQVAEIYNNTFYNKCANPSNWCFFIRSYSNPTIKNNVFYADHTGGDMLSGGTFTGVEDYNLWYPTKDPDDDGANSKIGNPLFANIGTKDFSLQPSSLAIDKGVNLSSLFTTDFAGTTRPRGSGYDIGAYEYNSGSTSNPADVNQDTKINIQDIQICVKVITGALTNPRADVNGDGAKNIKDIQQIVRAIVNPQY